MDTTEEQRIISFCTGYGGIELGLRRTGLNTRTVCYVEIEAFAQANLVAKIEEGKMDEAPIWSDLKTFPAENFHGKIHGITGGYPCQPFSAAGQRKGAEDPRHLWPYIREHIRAIRPVWCFFENVRGHVTLGLREVKRDLEQLGYRVKAGIFSAEEVGSSHKRERIFILAYSNSFGMEDIWDGESGQLDKANTRDKDVANGSSAGLQGYSRDEQTEGRKEARKDRPASKSSVSLWPSRPKNPNANGKNQGVLNPAWVAQLMGITPEWISFGSWVTESSRKQQS